VRYRNPEVDRLIEGAASAADDRLRQDFYTKAQRLIAADVPYISLWYKTNVAVFQPDIHGVSLSPIADFTFLRNVYRQAGTHGSGS
jgi:ABC-type transport system substrate-binding protein